MARTTSWTPFAAALLASVAFVPPAAADSITRLPVTGYGDIVVDAEHRQVFVSGGRGNAAIVVLDLDGRIVETIVNQPGAFGLALSPDRSRLYVTLLDWDAISVIDTESLQEVARYVTAPAHAPGSVTFSGGRVWFGFGCPYGGVASVDPDGRDLDIYSGNGETYPWYCPIVASTPEHPDVLVASDTGLSPATLYAYDTSTDPPTLIAAKRDPAGTSNMRDIAVDPDGTSVVTASGAPYFQQRFRLSDFARIGTYVTDAYPNAVAISLDGAWVAGGISAWYDADVYVFSRASSVPLAAYEFGGSATPELFPGGLAFGPDGGKLFAVTGNHEGAVDFRVLENPRLVGSSLAMSVSPARATVGESVTMAGTLTTSDATSVGSQRIAISVRPPGGTALAIATATTDSRGRFAYSSPDPLARAGRYTFAASWAGDARHRGSAVAADVDVKKRATAVSLAVSASAIAYGDRVTVRAHLSGGSSWASVSIYATPSGRPKALLAAAPVDAAGNVSATIQPEKNTRFIAEYAGDDGNASATIETRGVSVRPLVRSRLLGSFTASNGNLLYHRAATLRFLVTVVPQHPGRCTYLRLQRKTAAGWRQAPAPRCVRTSNAGIASALFARLPVGVRFRIGTEFRGDSDHASALGRWHYFRYTR